MMDAQADRKTSSYSGGRCRRLAAVALLGLALLGAGCTDRTSASDRTSAADPPAPASQARNLVILCIDTLRADHVGAYGYERATTPNIDALARSGSRFERTIAQSDWTVPATASLMTGVYPSVHGAGIDGDVRLLGETPPNQIRSDVETLAQILQGRGVHTGLFSANPYLYGRFKDGFDVAQVDRMNAGDLTDAALDWLKGTATEPFFLYMQYMDVHPPTEPPEPYFSFFKVENGGVRGKQHTDWSYGAQVNLQDPLFLRFRANRLALYDGALRYIDTEIARIVQSLESAGELKDTLVIITSDHGEEFWDHATEERVLGGDPRGIWGVGHGQSMFQELLWVPLIFHGPGVALGRTLDCDSRQIDIAPTALAMLGRSGASGMQGRSLAPVVTGRSDSECAKPVPEIAESPAYGPNSAAVIWKNYKLIVRQDGVELLYNLKADPEERTNLVSSQPRAAAKLRKLLRDELARRKATGKSEKIQFDEETRKQLRSLGYIQ